MVPFTPLLKDGLKKRYSVNAVESDDSLEHVYTADVYLYLHSTYYPLVIQGVSGNLNLQDLLCLFLEDSDFGALIIVNLSLLLLL